MFLLKVITLFPSLLIIIILVIVVLFFFFFVFFETFCCLCVCSSIKRLRILHYWEKLVVGDANAFALLPSLRRALKNMFRVLFFLSLFFENFTFCLLLHWSVVVGEKREQSLSSKTLFLFLSKQQRARTNTQFALCSFLRCCYCV